MLGKYATGKASARVHAFGDRPYVMGSRSAATSSNGASSEGVLGTGATATGGDGGTGCDFALIGRPVVTCARKSAIVGGAGMCPLPGGYRMPMALGSVLDDRFTLAI